MRYISILATEETRDLLMTLKKRLNFPSLNKLLYEMSFFIYENKIDITNSNHLSNERDKMNELKRYIDLKFKKQQDGEQSLRKFLGKLEHEYLIPTTMKIEDLHSKKRSEIEEVFDETISETKTEVEKFQNKIDILEKDNKRLNEHIKFQDSEFEKWRKFEDKYLSIISEIKEENSIMHGKRLYLDMSIERLNQIKNV